MAGDVMVARALSSAKQPPVAKNLGRFELQGSAVLLQEHARCSLLPVLV